MQIELRAISVQNFTSPPAVLSIRFDDDRFTTIPKILFAKFSELQLFDSDDLSSTRNVFLPFLSNFSPHQDVLLPIAIFL